MLKRIVSGGQTGVDRAAVDAAIKFNFDYGGYIPEGRFAEDGVIPEKYRKFVELNSKNYAIRTKKNVECSDGTVVIYRGKFGRGTSLTLNYAKEVAKPLLTIDMSMLSVDEAVERLKGFILANSIEVLNVAGPRASVDNGIYYLVFILISRLLSKLSFEKEY